MRETRPRWYRTIRTIGGAPWVPFEVARALQEQLDTHWRRVQHAEAELAKARSMVQRLAAEQAEQAQADAERVRAEAADAAEALSHREPCPPPDTDARVQRLREDLDRIRARTQRDVATARADERDRSLLRSVALYDDLRRGLEALPEDPSSPWYKGYRAVLQQLEDQLAQAGATPFAQPDEPFDPERHEAVGTTMVPPNQDGRLVRVLQSGFTADDGGLIRPAKVVVGRAEA